ncbi:hypothetical protein OIO90_006122 [Microbotryomycetes sp. JL221]|nr:hypothetical protein OIO90_006122 [Microbotryomycetes sp. JL221]
MRVTSSFALCSVFWAVATCVQAQRDNGQSSTAKGPTIGSPTLYQCTAASFQYQCDETPCIVAIRPSGDPTTSVKQFDDLKQDQGRVTWTPSNKMKAGEKVIAYITNSLGVENYSAELVINKSDVNSKPDDSERDGDNADPNERHRENGDDDNRASESLVTRPRQETRTKTADASGQTGALTADRTSTASAEDSEARQVKSKFDCTASTKGLVTHLCCSASGAQATQPAKTDQPGSGAGNIAMLALKSTIKMSRHSTTRFICLTALFSTVISVTRAQTVMNQPPAVYQCTVAAFPYQCADTPCLVSFRPADDPAGLYFQTETDSASGTISWTVNVKAGEEVIGYITEASGLTPTTGRIKVSPGRDGCDLGETIVSTSGDGGNSDAATVTRPTDTSSNSSPATTSIGKSSQQL